MTDETGPVPGRADYASLVATGERVTGQIAALRADLKGAEDRTAGRVAAAETKNAQALDAEKAARRRSQRRLLFAVAFDVTLTIVLATVLSGQADTNRRLAETNRRIESSLSQNYITQQQQADTRVRVLCPLYTFLLTSVDPVHTAELTPDERARSVAAMQVIRDGYTTLGCQPPLP